jgi:hypothetical protein
VRDLISRIRRAALQTNKLFEISHHEVSMMSTLAVAAGFAHTGVTVERVRPRHYCYPWV